MSEDKNDVLFRHNGCINAGYDFNLVKNSFIEPEQLATRRNSEVGQIIYSGCSVRDEWVASAAHDIKELHALHPGAPITVTGCVARTAVRELLDQLPGIDVRFATNDELIAEQGTNIDEVDLITQQGERVDYESGGRFGSRRRLTKEKLGVVDAMNRQLPSDVATEMIRLYKSTTKGFVFYNEEKPFECLTVTRGCLYSCSFCTIPKGRGVFRSTPYDLVLGKALNAIDKGIKRFVLLGDEAGNYGCDNEGPGFADMLGGLLDIDPDITLSVRYIEPIPFLRHFDLLYDLAKSGRMELLYVSMQHGSQDVLRAMNRHYSIDQCVTKIRQLVDATGVVVYSNWMSGFPTEQEEDHLANIEAMNRSGAQINVAVPFSARDGTKAAEMSQLPSDVVSRRNDAVSEEAARIKREMFASRMSDFDVIEVNDLLNLIYDAELQQYE